MRGATVAKLSENFRSTGAIVRASGAAVAPNEGREPKATWTQQPPGAKASCLPPLLLTARTHNPAAYPSSSSAPR